MMQLCSASPVFGLLRPRTRQFFAFLSDRSTTSPPAPRGIYISISIKFKSRVRCAWRPYLYPHLHLFPCRHPTRDMRHGCRCLQTSLCGRKIRGGGVRLHHHHHQAIPPQKKQIKKSHHLIRVVVCGLVPLVTTSTRSTLKSTHTHTYIYIYIHRHTTRSGGWGVR